MMDLPKGALADESAQLDILTGLLPDLPTCMALNRVHTPGDSASKDCMFR